MSERARTEVLVDGVRYVPVSEAHISARAIEDALMSQYWGDNWRAEYPHALDFSRVVVDGEPDDDSGGVPVLQFVAHILAAAQEGA